MRNAINRCLGIAGLLIVSIHSAYADRRVALVIGNSAYQHVPTLTNPRQDSRAMRDTLETLGFEVVYGEDLNRKQMGQTIARFAEQVHDADVALAYYAGHGSTFGDSSYLVPVDAEFTRLEGMPYELVSLESVLGELRQARGVRIALIDACRDNEAERALKGTNQRATSYNRGLTRVTSPQGLILAFSTQYGSTAADGFGTQNSPFTAAVLKLLPTPGLDIKEVFYGVGREVLGNTQGKQRPAIEISLYDNYTLVAARPTPIAIAPVPAPTQPSITSNQSILNLIAVLNDRTALVQLTNNDDSIIRKAAIERLAMLPKPEDFRKETIPTKPTSIQNTNAEPPPAIITPQLPPISKPASVSTPSSPIGRPAPYVRPKPAIRVDSTPDHQKRVVASSTQGAAGGTKRKRCFPFDGEILCQ